MTVANSLLLVHDQLDFAHQTLLGAADVFFLALTLFFSSFFLCASVRDCRNDGECSNEAQRKGAAKSPEKHALKVALPDGLDEFLGGVESIVGQG